MSEPTFTGMTPAQMAALVTPAMAATMTTAMQAQHQDMRNESMKAMQLTAARLPVDMNGKAFSRFAACAVQQSSAFAAPTLPTALVGASVSVVATSGERVKVRYLNGEEREFHKNELAIQ